MAPPVTAPPVVDRVKVVVLFAVVTGLSVTNRAAITVAANGTATEKVLVSATRTNVPTKIGSVCLTLAAAIVPTEPPEESVTTLFPEENIRTG